MQAALLELVEPPDHVNTRLLRSLKGEGRLEGVAASRNGVVDLSDDRRVQYEQQLMQARVTLLVLDPSLGVKLDVLPWGGSDNGCGLPILLQGHAVCIAVHSLPTLFVIGAAVLQLLPDGSILLQPGRSLLRALAEVVANLGQLSV